MRHRLAHRKFGLSVAHRRAMFRNMATSFLQTGRIETTLHRAKDLRPIVEKLITLGGRDTLHARRQAYGYLTDKQVVHKLFAELGPQYKTRPGGYTRVLRLGRRSGDAAEMALIELVGENSPVSTKKAAPKKASKKKAAAATPSEESGSEVAEAQEQPKKKAAPKKSSPKKATKSKTE
ncbi:MAG: 50S ribosomal protein L17 [Bdellovibrionales bacterium]|nr:50S ribosomal protein L17 [Bdellovibrionales bacterium]